MSLLRQLWLSVVVAMVVLLFGSLGVSIATARGYLEQQLLTQGANGAASLALSMSQLAADPATAETLINAMFDSGYYQRITYQDVTGKLLVERKAVHDDLPAPAWFVSMTPIKAKPGAQLVSRGWQQAGEVTVQAHTRYAYEALWHGSQRMGSMLLAAGVLWGIGITWLMKRIRRPLDDMAGQAEAIGEGRFMTVTEPRVSELRSVARALNRMADRVRGMFADQAARIESLRDEAARDKTSGLPNRSFFMGELRRLLSDESAPEEGALILLRLDRLAEINQHLGHQRTDKLIHTLGQQMLALVDNHPETTVARLNGPDFGILLPMVHDNEATALAGQMRRTLAEGATSFELDSPLCIHVAVSAYRRGEGVPSLLTRTDNALMNAEGSGHIELAPRGDGSSQVTQGEAGWRQMLLHALEECRFYLDFFPVLDTEGKLIHREGMLRLIGHDGAPISAGRFMPAAQRVGLVAECDLVTIQLALADLASNHDDVAVNLSPDALLAPHFLNRLQQLLNHAGPATNRLWIEVNERGLDAHLGGLEALADLLAQHRCHFGLEHFGQRLSALPKLYALRLAYLKVDGAFVASVQDNEGNQKLIAAITGVAGGLDIRVFAEQVHDHDEWTCLQSLGVAGMTGPEATRRLGE